MFIYVCKPAGTHIFQETYATNKKCICDEQIYVLFQGFSTNTIFLKLEICKIHKNVEIFSLLAQPQITKC